MFTNKVQKGKETLGYKNKNIWVVGGLSFELLGKFFLYQYRAFFIIYNLADDYTVISTQ